MKSNFQQSNENNETTEIFIKGLKIKRSIDAKWFRIEYNRIETFILITTTITNEHNLKKTKKNHGLIHGSMLFNVIGYKFGQSNHMSN